MAEFTLYCFAQSGNAYKAALMLQLCGADWRPRFVDFFNGETREPLYRALNEMGEVPVLIHRDKALTQSGVILDYLAEHFGRFGPADSDEGREILRWLLWDNHKLTGYTATYRYLSFIKPGGEKPVLDAFRHRMLAAHEVLENHLEDREWVVAERPTIADFSLCGYLYWPAEFGIDWDNERPNIAEWLARIQRLPGWKAPYDLMPDKPGG
ncbi:glutathione S-transferase [Methyloligella sp. 2.7D]|uniref:glutathione S-transferase family protein n=1 Tax=unclassified Methyloligella TaxID=2625955 RepID=UPI00157C6979|nr:glutathione S-transferase [Methyloligella sp. GL2]QKP76384.1 glutathione S-transferase N-terminal domain-containing protein [Methyloligella sp. GL2]